MVPVNRNTQRGIRACWVFLLMNLIVSMGNTFLDNEIFQKSKTTQRDKNPWLLILVNMVQCCPVE